MKRHGLVLVALLAILVTGLLLWHCGWLSARSVPAGMPRRHDPELRDEFPDPLTSQAAWRWRSGSPNHWRACLLQH